MLLRTVNERPNLELLPETCCTWCVDLIVVDGSVDGVVDHVGVVVEAEVTKHLHRSRQRRNRVCLLRPDQFLKRQRQKVRRPEKRHLKDDLNKGFGHGQTLANRTKPGVSFQL